MATEFAKYLAAQLPKFGNRARMASAIGISPTRLSRALNVGDYPLDVRNCLQLAIAADLSPAEVLRKAGKGDIADLIERLYGPGVDSLKESQREVLELWDAIDDNEGRAAVLTTMKLLARPTTHDAPRGGDSIGSGPVRRGTAKTANAARRTRRP